MSLIDSITHLLNPAKEEAVTPPGYCPNCWGRQEYAGKFLDKMEEERIDLNNVSEKLGWIQAHAVKHFEGIKIHETHDKFECPSCKLTVK